MPEHHGGSIPFSELLPLLILGGVLAVYLAAAARQQRRPAGWSIWRTGFFVAGIALLAAAWSPPMVKLAYSDLSRHMLQHLLAGMFAPLGLVLAAPVTLALRSLPGLASRRIALALSHRALRWLGNPIIALLLNTGGMYLLYLTPLYTASMEDGRVHTLVQIHFVLAGCLFTWAIAAPSPFPYRKSMRARLVVLVLSLAAHANLGKLMYAYNLPNAGPHVMEGQVRAAAQLMYYGGDLAELLLAVAVFTQWYRARSSSAQSRVASL